MGGRRNKVKSTKKVKCCSAPQHFRAGTPIYYSPIVITSKKQCKPCAKIMSVARFTSKFEASSADRLDCSLQLGNNSLIDGSIIDILVSCSCT